MRHGHGHGDATRLLVEDIDLSAFDAAVRSGGSDEEATRLALANDFLGPRRFGKLFPDLEPFRPPDDALDQLGRSMLDPDPQDASGDASIAAGVTYLAQFVDHDLTFDQTDGFPEITDPAEIEQARTPTLDLDSLYGNGPVRQPELYTGALGDSKFVIGSSDALPSSGGIGAPDVPVSLPNDLPRRNDKSAIIGDPRNDENLVVAQTHLAFLKFHNRVLDTVPSAPAPSQPSYRYTPQEEDSEDSRFHRARRLVRWHYQWIMLHDFLPSFVDPAAVTDVLENGRRFYDFDAAPFEGQPFMPLEFSVAAYRMGHSMIREFYDYNRVFNGKGPPALTSASLGLLFTFTGGGGFRDPHVTLPSNWIIDWRRFFDVGRPDLVNKARTLDARISSQLHQLPMPSVVGNPPNSLPIRNLLRGSRVGLPSAQDVAEAMGITAIGPAELGADEDKAREHGFDERSPLWWYILKEAQLQGAGNRLGEMGSRIVAEVVVGLLQGDDTSFVAVEPSWTPTLPSASPGQFTMSDLLRFVNDLNPIGAGPEGP